MGKGRARTRERLAVAYHGITEPLLQGRLSGGVERTLAELQGAKELKPYLAAAVKAECILLKPHSAYERVPERYPAQRRGGERRSEALADWAATAPNDPLPEVRLTWREDEE